MIWFWKLSLVVECDDDPTLVGSRKEYALGAHNKNGLNG